MTFSLIKASLSEIFPFLSSGGSRPHQVVFISFVPRFYVNMELFRPAKPTHISPDIQGFVAVCRPIRRLRTVS